MSREYLPAAPLIEAVQRRGIQVGRSSLAQAYYRARRGRLTVWQADVLAVKLVGEHPAMLWGPLWWEGADDELVASQAGSRHSLPLVPHPNDSNEGR
jgi:hypothetical protein